MKFGLALILVAFGLFLNFSFGVMAIPNVDELDIAGIVKVLESRDVPAYIIEGVKIKLMARHEPFTVTTCIPPVVPTTPPVEVPPTSVAPPPATDPVAPPATTAPSPVDPPAATPATSEVVTCTPATTEPTGIPGIPSSSVSTAPTAPTIPTSEVPATSTGTLTETSTEFSSTGTSIVETVTTRPDTPASSTPPAPVNAAVLAKMDAVAVGLAALAALY